ncbi:MAG: hypothetical protein K2J63_12480 [Muribaculaceae bacterium]|nr:hypothetical protein [Muribaculaceae bacterium]
MRMYHLGDSLNVDNPPSQKQHISVAFQITETLAYIHSMGLSHHDLKPDNILTTHWNEAKKSTSVLGIVRIR